MQTRFLNETYAKIDLIALSRKHNGQGLRRGKEPLEDLGRGHAVN